MKKSDLHLQGQLIDTVTGEIIGYFYGVDTFNPDKHSFSRIALTKEKAIELGLEDAEICEYFECEVIECLYARGKFSLSQNILFTLGEFKDNDYEIIDNNTVAIYGNVVKKNTLCDLNSSYFISLLQN